MRKFKSNINRFFLRNRDKGIPNLMLYIALGNAVVTIFSLLPGGSMLYYWLCFDKTAILNGEVWRLFTYVFTQSGSDIISLIFIYFFYMLGRHVEISMGTFRFNLYYLSGIILMNVFAMIFCPVYTSEIEALMYRDTLLLYQKMAYYLHLSLLLTFATTNPDSQFLLLMFIPIKASIIAIIYLILIVVDVVGLSYPVFNFPHNLFPLVAVANYLLFAGGNIRNLLPARLRYRRSRPRRPAGTDPIPFRKEPHKEKADYNHKCVICGRTDVSNPDLEFRYCSRCKGYHCYCQDHINDHTHIQ